MGKKVSFKVKKLLVIAAKDRLYGVRALCNTAYSLHEATVLRASACLKMLNLPYLCWGFIHVIPQTSCKEAAALPFTFQLFSLFSLRVLWCLFDICGRNHTNSPCCNFPHSPFPPPLSQYSISTIPPCFGFPPEKLVELAAILPGLPRGLYSLWL